MTAVLLYHDVVDPPARDLVGFPGSLAARYKLDLGQFSAHLDAIAACGIGAGLLDDDPRPGVAFSFDDAGASAPVAASMLEERGWRGYFFAPTARVGTPGFVDGSTLRDLVDRGHVVGSHSHTHPTYMGRLSRAQLDDEWHRSRDFLAELLGREPDVASVPGGYLSPAVVESAASCGYRLLMTSEPTQAQKDVGGMTVVGRFGIWSSTPARHAAAYARGDRGPRARLWLEWRAKHAAKRISPQAYQRLRRLRTRV